MKTDSKLVEFAAKLHIAEKLAVELGTDIESAVAKHNAAIDAILNPEVPNNDDLDPEQVNGLDVVGRRENESIATLDRELSSLRALADVVPKAIQLVGSIAEQAEIFEVASFYAHFDVIADDQVPAEITVRVCESLSCWMHGVDWARRD